MSVFVAAPAGWLAFAPNPPKGEAAKAGPWWLVVVLALAIALFFLVRSMLHHMKKVQRLPDAEAPPEPPGDEPRTS